MKRIKVTECFESIQGEGQFAGYPMLFIRTYGCTKRCSFCDSLYAVEGNNYKEMTISELVKEINKSKLDYVCWTGGEPLLWREQIFEITKKTDNKFHHVETNGDLLIESDFSLFNYLGISPKDLKTTKKVKGIHNDSKWIGNYDIKIVTDLKKVGKDLIPYATMLMCLTVYEPKEDLEIQKKVWDYCVQHNIRFSPRYQFWIWDKKKGV